MTDKLQIMVVDDSPYMTRLLSDLVDSQPEMQVMETARDGAEAIRKLKRRRPDVILLDLEMPRMDGLTFLQKTMGESPVPVIVVSGFGQTGYQIIFDALEAGAVDFVPITEDSSGNLRSLRSALISRIEVAANVNLEVLMRRRMARRQRIQNKGRERTDAASRVVVIGGSTGAPTVLQNVLAELPGDLAAGVLIVQHMPGAFTKSFAHRLDEASELAVRQAKEGELVREGVALLAPGDYHMLIRESGRIRLSGAPKRLGVRPSTNMLMVSASNVFGPNTVGVLLSGMGEDGAFGMKVIKNRGGTTIGQDEDSSIVFGMARAAADSQAIDRLVPAEKLSQAILEAVEEKVAEGQGQV